MDKSFVSMWVLSFFLPPHVRTRCPNRSHTCQTLPIVVTLRPVRALRKCEIITSAYVKGARLDVHKYYWDATLCLGSRFCCSLSGSRNKTTLKWGSNFVWHWRPQAHHSVYRYIWRAISDHNFSLVLYTIHDASHMSTTQRHPLYNLS